MSELLKKIKTRLQNNPTSVKEIIEIAKSFGKKLSTNGANELLYNMDYTYSRTLKKWVFAPQAKANRLKDTIEKLEKSETLDFDQAFLITIINAKYQQVTEIVDALEKKGLKKQLNNISYNIAKYGVQKNKQGYFVIPGLLSHLKQIAQKYKDRRCLSLEEVILEKLNKQPTTSHAVIQLTKQLKHPKTNDWVLAFLYGANYTLKEGSWIFDAKAKFKRIDAALRKLQDSSTCDKEQGFLLEVINHDHNTINSIVNAFHKKDIKLTNRAVYYYSVKYGIQKNKAGFYKFPNLPNDLKEIAKQFSGFNKILKPYTADTSIQLKQRLKDTLNNQPTSSEKLMNLSKKLGFSISVSTAIKILYEMDYIPQGTFEGWVYDPKAKQNRVNSAINNLQNSIIFDSEQALLLEIINNRYETIEAVKDALCKKGINFTINMLDHSFVKYGIQKNKAGVYEIAGVSRKNKLIAKENKNRKYCSVKQALQTELDNQPITIKELLGIAKRFNISMEPIEAMQFLYEIHYSPTKKQNKWAFDPNAKKKRLETALANLDKYELCDKEQCFILEIINSQHQSVDAIKEALSQRGLDVESTFIYYQMAKYGVLKNQAGFYEIGELSEKNKQMAQTHMTRNLLTLTEAIKKELGQKAVTVNQVKEIAKNFGNTVSVSWVIEFLYRESYKVTGKGGVWKYDANAIANRVEAAIKSLGSSEICTREQLILLEVMNNEHKTESSIQKSIVKKYHAVSRGFVGRFITKYGVKKGKAGFYQIPSLSNQLTEIAKNHKDRSYNSQEQFIIDLAKKRDGHYDTNSLFNTLKKEGFKEYHKITTPQTLVNWLVKNGFVFEGDGDLINQKIYYSPNHCHDLIRQAYISFSDHQNYHDHVAIVLYYVSHQNLTNVKLKKLLETKHGITAGYAEKAINTLRLVKTKEGLRFPEGSNNSENVSRYAFRKATESYTPKSIADYIWALANNGLSIEAIEDKIGFELSVNQIEKLLKNKEKYSRQKTTSSPSSAGGEQNSLANNPRDGLTSPRKYTKFEPDYIERLAKENKKRFKEALQKAQKNFERETQRMGQSKLPKQNFIYKPYEKKSLGRVYCVADEGQLIQRQYGIQYKLPPMELYEIPNIFQLNRNQGQVIQLFMSTQQANQVSSSIVGYDGSLRQTGGGSGSTQARGLLKSIPTTPEKSSINILRQIRSFAKPSGNGLLIEGPGFLKSAGRGQIIQGPRAAIPSMPMAGKIAGGYIGVFMVLPQAYNDVVIIASPKTEMIEKELAILDLGVMVGFMWTFTKLVASKYPKTAAAIMVGVAGSHAYNTTVEFYDSLGNGKTKSTVIFLNEKAYLKSGMSCVDGRRVKLLNPKAAGYASLGELKK